MPLLPPFIVKANSLNLAKQWHLLPFSPNLISVPPAHQKISSLEILKIPLPMLEEQNLECWRTANVEKVLANTITKDLSAIAIIFMIVLPGGMGRGPRPPGWGGGLVLFPALFDTTTPFPSSHLNTAGRFSIAANEHDVASHLATASLNN